MSISKSGIINTKKRRRQVKIGRKERKLKKSKRRERHVQKCINYINKFCPKFNFKVSVFINEN